MKKILLIGAATFAAFMLFKPDSTSAGDPNEGRIVLASSGNVFVIKDGKRYHLTSEQAHDDYVAAYPQFAEGIQLTDAELTPYPIAGALYAGLSFQS